MMAPRDSQTQVWVGNVPYDASEDELREIMQTVGPVASIRIRYDKETGQSRGFAFCEYRDPETCAIAIRNISGLELRGRALRVDWATAEMKQRYQSALAAAAGMPHRADRSEARGAGIASGGRFQNLHPSVPAAAAPSSLGASVSTAPTTLPASKSASGDADEEMSITSEICQIINSMSVAQLLYVVAHMQKLVVQSPDTARALLTENPQLCYALLHAEFLLGLIDEPFTAFSSDAEFRRAEDLRKARQADAGSIYDRAFAQRNADAAAQAAAFHDSSSGGSGTGQQQLSAVPNVSAKPHYPHSDDHQSDNAAMMSTGPTGGVVAGASSLAGRPVSLDSIIRSSEVASGEPADSTSHERRPRPSDSAPQTVDSASSAIQSENPVPAGYEPVSALVPTQAKSQPGGIVEGIAAAAEPVAAAAAPFPLSAAPSLSPAPSQGLEVESADREMTQSSEDVKPADSNPVIETPTTANGDLLDQILQNPEFVQRLLTVDPASEQNWSEEERQQVEMIQEALKARGIGVDALQCYATPSIE